MRQIHSKIGYEIVVDTPIPKPKKMERKSKRTTSRTTVYGSLAFLFLLFSLFLASHAVYGKKVDSSNRHIFKPNLGLFLRHIEHISPSSLTWSHLITIELPQKELSMGRTFNTDSDPLGTALSQATRRLEAKVCSQNVSTSCRQFLNNLKFTLSMARDKIEQIRTLLIAIHDLTPQTDLTYDNFRAQRSLIPAIGGIFSSLFGVATQNDINILAQQIYDVKKLQNFQLNIFQNSTRNLASYIRISQDRMERMQNLVTTSVKETTRILSDMQDSFTEQLDFLNMAILYNFRTEHHLSVLLHHTSLFLGALEMLASGHIPTYLIPLEVLQDSVDNIARTLQKRQNKYQLISMDASTLYHNARYSYLKHDNLLHVFIHLGLTEFKVPFSIYSTEVLPLTLPNQENQRQVQLSGIPEVIMVSDDYAFYHELTQVELNLLRINQFFSQHFVYRNDFKQSCLYAAIKNDMKAIDQRCKYHIYPSDKQPVIYHLFDQKYYLFNAPTIWLQCNDDNPRENPGCLSCVYDLRKNCTLTAGHLYAPATFGIEESQKEVQALQHSFPLPVLRKFLANNTNYDDILKTELLLESAPVFNTPRFQFFSNDITNKIAAVDKSKIDLDRAVQSVITDDVVISELGQLMLTENLFAPFDFNWSAPQSIVSEISSIAILIILIVLIYLVIKLHRLAALVTVLSQSLPRTQAQLVGLTKAPIRFELAPNEDMTSLDKNPTFLSFNYIDEKLQYIIFILIVFILVLYFLRKMYYKIVRKCFCNRHGTIVLQCVYQEICLNITLIRLESSPVDYTYSTTGTLSEIHVEGYFHPHLKFSYPNFQATHKYTHQSTPIATTIAIPIIQALLLRFMLAKVDQTLFHAYPLTQFQGVQYALPINELSPSPPDRTEPIYATVHHG